jgi:low temperature requirement protein LtrA
VYSLSLTTKTMTIIAASALLAGCATAPSDISAAYVSPVLYQNYTCQQLSMEAQSVSARAAQVAGVQENKRTNDAVATGVAIVLFWPAAFLVKRDGPTAAELGQLKGQMMAIEQANIAKRCGLQFNRGN